ncbi:MAG: T9SS type A sorting domain-containing protein [Chitinophagales bacterium]|nr:T9SS type A sorting domain-containing protein [Bacteroidota bacterium]MBP9547743.1 T9SS type A sorting domain-containing protein [Chitinophagales bacterium]
MKRLITSILTVFITIYAIGQAPVVNTPAKLMPARGNAIVDLEQPAFYKNNVANALISNNSNKGSSRAGEEFIAIGTAYNLYTILLAPQSQVSYIPEINSVAFVHRQNSGEPGGSGAIAYDLSTDGGATWVTNNVVTPDFVAGTSGMDGNRYPSGSLWNPAGNTDPMNAYYLAHAPTLTPATGSWGATLQASMKLDGTDGSEVYFSEGGNSNDYIPFGINSYESGSAWSANMNLDGDTHYVYEITSDGAGGFDWNSTEVASDWYILADTTTATTTDYTVVFDHAGVIGYALFNGSLNSDGLHNIQPTILKTIDAGATWSYLPWFDLSGLSEIQDWIAASDLGAGPIKPYFSEMDAVVDADGKLNIFAAVLSGFTSNVDDSLYFIYADYTVMMHFTTSNGTDWTAKEIAYSTLTGVTFGAVAVTYNPQMSANADGDRIFMTWMNSDSLIFTEHTAPDIYAMGYNIESGDYTAERNVTAGTDYEYGAYYPTTASVSIDNGDSYEIPVVFALPGALDTDPPQFYYIKGLKFLESEFGGEPAAVANFNYTLGTLGSVTFTNTSSNATTYSWDFGDGTATSPLTSPTHTYTLEDTYEVCLTASNATSSNEICKDVLVDNIIAIEDVILANALKLYPSPASNVITVAINSNSFQNVTIEFFNMRGESAMKPVEINLNNGSTTSIDVSTLAEGNYIVRVYTDNGYAIRQISIVK